MTLHEAGLQCSQILQPGNHIKLGHTRDCRFTGYPILGDIVNLREYPSSSP